MGTPRRKCRLPDTNHADIDLRDYEKVITETVNRVSYGKLRGGVDVCKFGKQWVVSIDAMRREYGNPTA